MAVTLEKVKRVFKWDDRELADPNPNMTPEEVLQHYAPIYPELNNAEFEKEELVTDPVTREQRYEFRVETSVGTKG